MSGDNNQPIELEVQAPQTLQTQIAPYRRKWGEENKQRVMDLLAFKDKDLEDVAFSAIVYLSGSMFCSSLIFDSLSSSTRTNPIAASFIVIFGVVMALAGIVAWWLVEVVPESRVLVIGRLFLLIVGVALGASL